MSTIMIREPGLAPPLVAQQLIIRCRPGWREWVSRFSAAAETTSSELVGAALALLAETHGFEPPPPRL